MNQRNYKAKETMLVLTVAALICYLVFKATFWLYISLAIGIIGVLSFSLSAIIDRAWTKLAMILGEINNTILLTITFFLIVTPVALIRKLMGKKHLLSQQKKSSGYFSTRDHLYKKEDMEKLW